MPLWPISPELVLLPDFWVSNFPQYFCFALQDKLGHVGVYKASVTILADFGPEFNPPFRWRSKNQTKNHSA